MNSAVQTERQSLTAILKTIFERRSVRKYKDAPVSKELIELVLDAGRMAPSALNEQPWRFYVLTDREGVEVFSKEIWAITEADFAAQNLGNKLKGLIHSIHLFPLVALHPVDRVFHGAPVVIFITVEAENAWTGIDIGMCAENMMLAAKSLGLDTCPVGLGRYVKRTKSYPVLGIHPGEEVLLAIALGYGDETPAPRERACQNAMFITWDGNREVAGPAIPEN